MLAVVLVVTAFLHLFYTRVKISTNIGWKEVLLVLSMEYLIPVGWTVPTSFHGLNCPQCLTSLQAVPSTSFFDGHHSHISLQLIKEARENNVKLFCLPPNCTHIVQLLDMGVFGPMKKVWEKLLKQWKFKSKAQNVSKEIFPGLLRSFGLSC